MISWIFLNRTAGATMRLSFTVLFVPFCILPAYLLCFASILGLEKKGPRGRTRQPQHRLALAAGRHPSTSSRLLSSGNLFWQREMHLRSEK